jgi:hypothetical protein
MKILPYASVYIPWAAMIVCEIALFVVLWKRPGKTRYRGFEAYVTFTTAVSLVLLGISMFGDGSQYFTAYYLGAFLKSVAITLAVYEQYKIQFFPRWSMSARSFKLFMTGLSAIGLGAVAMVMFTPQQTPVLDLAWARRFMSVSDYLLCGSMGLLLLYGEFLKVERPARAQAIVRGFIATSALGITSALMLSVSATRNLGGIVGFSTTIGFLAILISWMIAFSKPEPVVAPEAAVAEESPLDKMVPGLPKAVVSQMLMWKL